MKPRILIYSTAYYPLVGGAEVAVKEITDRLGDDFDFDLITARINKNFPKLEQIGNVTVYRLGWGTIFDKIWLAVRGGEFGFSLHQKKPYHLVWAIMASFGGFAASSFKNKSKDVPYLLTLQEGDDLGAIEYKVRFVRKTFNNIFRRADYIQCISNYLADWAKRIGASAVIRVVPNGVDLDRFKSQNSGVKILKANREKVIITTSRLVKKNGIDDLIKSLAFLPGEVKLWILGVGPEEKALKNLSVGLGLAPRIVWVGFVDNTQLLPYLEKADVFVRPSLSEGLGNSFLEAMAVGLPTVGTPVGGIVDFLRPGDTGWLVEVHDPRSIAQTVSFIFEEKNQREVERIARAGRDLVYSTYDWKIVVSQIKDIFGKLLKLSK